MQKYGEVWFKDSDVRYQFAWTVDGAAFERLDVLSDLRDYNFGDTSNCIAAYYHSRKEMYYGDDSIIKRIFAAKSKASIFNAPMKTDFVIENGEVITTQLKSDAKLGLKYERKQKFGKDVFEYYETDDTVIDISSIQEDRGITIAPINVADYSVYDAGKEKFVASTDDAEFYSEEYLRANFDIGHIDECDYVVVQSMEEAKQRLAQWRDAPTKVKAVDLETTGVETGMYGGDCITGVVLSYSEDDSTFYPFRQERCPYNLPISFLQTLLDTVNSQPEDVVIIAHNGKFEKQGVWKEHKDWIKYSEYAMNFSDEVPGLDRPDVRIDRDTFLLSILCDPRFLRGLHSLKHLVNRITGKFYLELSDIFKDKNNIRFNVLPPELIRLYACPDTPNTIRVYNYLIKKLPPKEMGIFRLECELLPVSATNEFFGMRIDQKKLVDSLEGEEYKVNLLSDYFQKIHGISANINSNDVRRDIFYNRLRCPVEVRTKTGQPSTSNEALKRIVELGTLKEIPVGSENCKSIVDLNGKVIVKGEELAKNKYPSLVILNKYAKSMKEYGAFKRIRRKSLRDRVMFSINQAGAATGRQTSDAHQYSDGMKMLVLPDSEDHYLWSSDYKQMELRILAFLAGQEDLIELESNPTIDVHRAILSIILHKPIWQISATERKKGKSTNFGVVYMMSPYGLAKKNAGPAYTKEDLMAAYDSINGFYNGLPKIKQFVEKNKQFVLENGYIETLFHRIRPFKEILDPTITESQKSSKIRAANNTPVQGFGADMMKIVECTINDYIKEHGWDELVDCDGVMLPKVRIMLSIHDEVLVSSHKSIPHEDIITMFKVCMEQKVEGAPPFFSAPALVNSWYDGKLDKYEMDLLFRDEVVETWANEHRRILHVGSFCNEHDMYDIKEVEKLAKQLREQFDIKDAEKDITDEVVQEALRFLDEEKIRLLCDAYISEHDENVKTDKDRRELAIARAMDKDFSQYLYDLAVFRNNRLKDWMDGLIQKYKTPEAIAEHAHDDELTHTLISTYITKDDHFSHEESILESVKRYLKKMNEGSTKLQTRSIVADAEDKMEDNEILNSFEELETFIQFDENGEAIIDESAEEEDDEYTITNNSAYCPSEAKRSYAIYMLSEVGIDLTSFKITSPEAEAIHQEIIKLSNPKNPYTVSYFIQGKKLDTGLRIGYIPDQIDRIVQEYEERIL